MNNIDISDVKALEKEFANDFSSPVFPVLGEIYLKNKDLDRAKKVCEVGLKYDPENINGYYILAKVYLYNNDLKKTEEILINIINKMPLHINALKLLIKVHEELKISNKKKIKYLKKLLDIFPDDQSLAKKIIDLDGDTIIKNKPKIINDSVEKDILQNKINFKIQPNMATLTFVNILREQRHYSEALHVLSLVESKLGLTKEIKKNKIQLQNLLSESP